MAYLLKIGAIKENVSGYGQRGYHCFRKGRCVIIRFAAVVVLRNRRVHWVHWPQELINEYESGHNAKQALGKLINKQTRGGYSRLPPKVNIRPPCG
jgi:hypothetical protein